MFRQLLKIILTAVMCVTAFTVTAYAQRAELVDLKDRQDIVVVISYDTEEPTVKITSPSGKTYSKDGDYSQADRGNNALYLYIKDAETGVWYIDYDKKGNSSVTAEVIPWQHPLSIDSLKINSWEENRLNASAEVSCEKETRFDYYVYAVTVNSQGETENKYELGNGSGSSGGTLDISVSTSGLMDGKYRLQLEAYYVTSDGTEIPSVFTTNDEFSVSGNTAQGSGEKFISVLDITQTTLKLDWSAVEDSVSSWHLSLCGKGKEEFYFADYESETVSDEVILDKDYGDLTAELIGTLNGGGYVKYEKQIVWDTGVTVTFDTPAATNSPHGTISYDTGDKTVNGTLFINEEAQQLSLSGSGSISFELDNMEVNEVSVRYGSDADGYHMVSQRISVDSIPPVLDLYGVGDKLVSAKEKFAVSGRTEYGAALSLNGSEVDIEASGNFTAEFTLKKGSNDLNFVATDPAGNKTSRVLTVTYDPSGDVAAANENSGEKFPWLMAVTAAASLMTLLLAWLFSSRAASGLKKANVPNSVPQRFISVFRGVSCSAVIFAAFMSVMSFYRYVKVTAPIKGKDLASAVQNNSTSGIAEIIRRGDSLKMSGIIWAAVAVLAVAAFVLLTLLAGKLRKKYKNSVCAKCGKPLKPGAKFCRFCGEKTDQGK